MHKLYGLTILIIILVAIFFGSLTHALSQNIVISQVQLGDANSASNEFVGLFNNSNLDIEITNWCLYYASASSGEIGSRMTCFLTENANIHIFLPKQSSLFLISNQLASAQPSVGSDFKFAATLSGTAGHVRLINDSGIEVDKLAWGTGAVSAEGLKPAPAVSAGKILNRKALLDNILVDTDVNLDDFEVITPKSSYSYGSVYEVQDLCGNIEGIQDAVPTGYSLDIINGCVLDPIDICGNIDGLQAGIPIGYELDEKGDCVVDLCLNLDGLQQAIPGGMELDMSGSCVGHDECANLEDVQSAVPVGYKKDESNNCKSDSLPLMITELLPNAIGVDVGREFIEFFNPNNVDVNLSNYRIRIGTKIYDFPGESFIKAGEYSAFFNSEINFTLANTSGVMILESTDGSLVDEVPVYENPSEGESWVLIDGLWQYTNQPTPSATNITSSINQIEIELADNVIKPCEPNQYRSSETNRCRNIVSASVLAACKDGQYRSEETGRCRNIANDVSSSIPCAEGQERNPATNRCRSISAVLGASDLVPCKEGQERNPDTNRCRNVVSSSVPKADFEPQKMTSGIDNNIALWSTAGVGTAAVGYGVWEWRQEMARFGRKLRSFVGPKK